MSSSAFARPARPPLKVLDATDFYSATASGGVKTYLHAKSAAFGEMGIAHVMVVPGERSVRTQLGRTVLYRIGGPRVPMSPAYRVMLSARRFSEVLEREQPDVIEVGSPFIVPHLVRRGLSGRTVPLVGFYHARHRAHLRGALRAQPGGPTPPRGGARDGPPFRASRLRAHGRHRGRVALGSGRADPDGRAQRALHRVGGGSGRLPPERGAGAAAGPRPLRDLARRLRRGVHGALLRGEDFTSTAGPTPVPKRSCASSAASGPNCEPAPAPAEAHFSWEWSFRRLAELYRELAHGRRGINPVDGRTDLATAHA